MKTVSPRINDFPLYTSEGGFKSLWQKYYVYRDRIVLNTILMKITIPFDDLIKAEISPPNIRVALRLGFAGNKFRPAMKFDLADFNEHIAIHRKSGIIKVLLITPDNLQLFKEYLDRAVENHRRNKRL